jgi:hypothetical protein
MQAWGLWVGVGSIALFGLACGSKGSDSGGTGGSPASATGGASSGGAATSSGGTTSATGGTTSAGGATAGGPSAGSGGASGGTGITMTYSFDSDLQGWGFEYGSSGPLPGADGGTAVVITKTTPGMTVMWVPTGGDPASTPGALQANIPFTSASQYVGIGLTLGGAVSGQPKLDLTGKVITANIKIVSQDGDPADLMTNPDGAKLYVKTGAGYVYASGDHVNAAVGLWTKLSLDMADPSMVDMTNGAFDATDVREIGVQLETSGTTKTAMSAVDLVDTISY